MKLSLLILSALILLITCKTSVNEYENKIAANNWLEEVTITRLQQGYKAGKYTIEEIVRTYLDRIMEIDKNGPKLNSIIMINPDAFRLPEDLDIEMAAGKTRGPLHGIPVILKDNIDTHDRMPTTAGATALRNSFPEKDSYVAKKLREAGAVIIGKI